MVDFILGEDSERQPLHPAGLHVNLRTFWKSNSYMYISPLLVTLIICKFNFLMRKFLTCLLWEKSQILGLSFVFLRHLYASLGAPFFLEISWCLSILSAGSPPPHTAKLVFFLSFLGDLGGGGGVRLDCRKMPLNPYAYTYLQENFQTTAFGLSIL